MAVRVIQGTAAPNRVSVFTHPAADSPVASADELHVRQILFNLLSNAVRYSPEGARVDVTVKRDGDWAQVLVVDSGVGIAPEDQERVFEEFVRVGPLREKVAGSGLGLPLTRQLVELHGGRIGLDSKPGKGSTFWFTLPLAAPDDTGQEAADRRAERLPRE
jgi:signal transduction histidine kinase